MCPTPVTARFLYREYFDFSSTHKLVMAGNTKPTIAESSHAL